MRTTLAAVIATGLLATAATAFTPAPDTPPTRTTATTPDVEVVVDEHGTTRTVNGLSDRFGFAPGDDLRDPLVWFERSRRVIEAQGLDTTAATDGECTGGCSADHDGPSSFTFVEAIGDLDGDGTDEVLATDVVLGDGDVTSTATARSGADGTVLWRTADEGLLFVSSVPDLDGDGLDDLLGGTFSGFFALTHDCATPLGLSCAAGEEGKFTLDLVGYRGIDGSRLGNHTTTERFTFQQRETLVPTGIGRAGDSTFEVTVEDGFFGLAIVDLDGDGRHQLVHERYDATFTQRATGTVNDTPAGFADVVVERTTDDVAGAIVLADLVTGVVTPIVEVADALPYGWVVQRSDGDLLAVDVLPEFGDVGTACVDVDPAPARCEDVPGAVTAGANDAEPTRTLYGRDLAPVWQTAVPSSSFFLHGAGADATGDGVEDLFDLRFDGETFEDAVTLVDGATGTDVWSAAASVLEVDGDRVIGSRVEFGEELTATGLVLDAATGAMRAERELVGVTLFEEDEDEVDSFTFGSLSLVIDELTAGSTDVLADVRLTSYAFEEECEVVEGPDGSDEESCTFAFGDVLREEADLRVVEGPDLTDVLRLQDPSFLLLDVVELDGDGAVELLGARLVAADFLLRLEDVRAIRLDGSQVWQLPDTERLVDVVDTADGTADVLTFDVGDEAGRVRVLDGADLTPRWAASVQ